jgi:hypothetical protein
MEIYAKHLIDKSDHKLKKLADDIEHFQSKSKRPLSANAMKLHNVIMENIELRKMHNALSRKVFGHD